MSQEQARKDLNKSIRKVGNAVLFSEASGKLWLVYVTVGFGGWAGASLNVTHSADLGATWSRSQPLPTSPFFNVSTLVRNNPVALQDGGWAVPTYHEFLGKFPEILWLKETGDGVQFSKTRITGGVSAFQPALVAISSREAIMLCRDTGGTRRIHLGRSVDAGRTWTTPKLLDLPNSNSGLCALRLTDGSVLLAFNDTLKNRDNLSLAISKDGGNSWKRAAVIENTPGQGFSYPCLVQTRDGLIHLSYSRNRDVIQYACFNRAWLEKPEVRP